MRRIALLAGPLAAVVVLVSGCGAVESLVRSRQAPRAPTGDAPIVSVEAPDPALADNAIVADSAHSVVRIRSTAPACQKVLEGSGFVIGPNRVMSNAHVVAGAQSFSVTADGQDHEASVVLFDPNLDISVLDVPGLSSRPLTFADDEAPSGTDALIMGYPGGESLRVEPARVREVIELSGPDIYRTTTVQREVYIIRGKVGQGDSGGPLIDLDGRVLGINYGSAVDDPDTGFVLTAKQVYSQLVISAGARQPVATGGCVT